MEQVRLFHSRRVPCSLITFFSFLRDLKSTCLDQIPHNKEFWKEIQKIGRPISLISSKEAKKAGGKSDVTEGTSVDVSK